MPIKGGSKKQGQCEKKRWLEELEILDSFARGIAGGQVKSRTFEENKLLILAPKGYLRIKVENGDAAINLNTIERERDCTLFLCAP